MDNRQQIHLENLSLRYRGIETSALKHISVDAEFGHVIGIIGNHHAGKTSLCRALAGIVPTIISGDNGNHSSWIIIAKFGLAEV